MVISYTNSSFIFYYGGDDYKTDGCNSVIFTLKLVQIKLQRTNEIKLVNSKHSNPYLKGEIMLNNTKKRILTVGIFGLMAVSAINHSNTLPKDVRATQVVSPCQIIITDDIPLTDNLSLNESVINELTSQKIIKKKLNKELKEERRRARIKARKKYIKSIVCDPNDVSRITGLKKEDFKYLTKGTWWSGKEHILYEVEQTYGINAMFTMSVSTLESGHGRSYRSQIRENYYGIELNHYWDNLYDNSLFFGKLIKKNHGKQGRKRVWNTSTKYCPPHHDMWANYMYEHMHKLNNKLISRLNSTNK